MSNSKARKLADLLADGAVGANELADGAAVPSQSGHSGKFLTTDGTDTSWGTVDLNSRVATSGDTMTGDLSFGDNDKAIFGAGSDLQVYHDGSHSRILDSGTGDLYLQGNNLYLTNTSGNNYFGAISGGASTVYYNNSAKLATTSTGVDVTGDIKANNRTITHDGYPVIATTTTAPSSPVDGQLWWDNSSGNVKIYDSTQSNWFLIKSGLDGSSASRAIPSIEEATQFLGNNFAKGVYWINTPDGGVQQAYLMYGDDRVWVLVGRWQNDASSSITNTMLSSRSMIQLDQSTSARYSADWGTQQIDEIMFWGATDFEAETGHTINWIYDVSQRPDLTWRSWSVGGTSGDNSTNGQVQLAVHNQKDGHYVDGARDGWFKGRRWVNTNYKYHRMSDSSSGTCWVNPYGLSNPISSVAYYHGMNDAKFSVSGNGSDTSGQDSNGTTSQLFGYDDNNRAFYDAGTGTVDNNATRRDFASAVTVWISPRS
jgi:hypothetical protein